MSDNNSSNGRKMTNQTERRDDKFEEAIAGLYSFEKNDDRARAKECIGIARRRLLSKPEHDVARFAEAILHGDQAHREWLQEAAQCWMDGKPLPEPRSNTHDYDQWIPKMGERVRVADDFPDAELWNKDELYVIGIRRSCSIGGKYNHALDVTLSTSWPEITDPTDGFIVGDPNRPDSIHPMP